MKKTIFNFVIISLLALTINSCKEDKVEQPKALTTGSVQLKMEYVWAMAQSDFQLNEMLYHPMSGDSLKFTVFKHYISNLKLKRTDGSYWVAPNSYHLLDVSVPSSLAIKLDNVPTGDYTGIEVTFGVDSLRNVSGAQTGDLAQSNGMFWSWNSGYIMIKAEGTSPQAAGGSFSYHIGGFSGVNTSLSVRALSFPSSEILKVNEGSMPVLHLLANPARLFHSYGSVSKGSKIHMPGVDAGKMAQDFNSWVNVEHIHQ